MRTTCWGKEFWSLNKWTRLKLKTFKRSTATFMWRVLPVWKNNISDKLDSFWKRSIEKNGSLLKRMLKFNIWFLKRETSSLISGIESLLWLLKWKLWRISWQFKMQNQLKRFMNLWIRSMTFRTKILEITKTTSKESKISNQESRNSKEKSIKNNPNTTLLRLIQTWEFNNSMASSIKLTSTWEMPMIPWTKADKKTRQISSSMKITEALARKKKQGFHHVSVSLKFCSRRKRIIPNHWEKTLPAMKNFCVLKLSRSIKQSVFWRIS